MLDEHLSVERLRQPHGVDLCFGLAPGCSFRADRLQERADTAWAAARQTLLTLHDCRHKFASFAIAAGVNAKALSSYMGHSSWRSRWAVKAISCWGNEAEAAVLLDGDLASAASASARK